MIREIEVKVNGRLYRARVEPRTLLVHMLRDTLGLTGAHIGCVVGKCGACTVLWRGKQVKSCMVFAVQTAGTEILTIEGLQKDGELHPLQRAFWDMDAAECGYCTPGMLMAAYGFLLANPDPAEDEIKHAIAGNLCRCTGYRNIVEAIKKAARQLREADHGQHPER
ncbi:MAG TPA: (2Fe-2S)-binding protein [Candidatus Acidoferrales bacterium]|nr:(2Fe-2S)-binding protein [Candidatus Acidoferrales bacterium]